MSDTLKDAVYALARPRLQIVSWWGGLAFLLAWFAIVLRETYLVMARTVEQLARGMAARPVQAESVRFLLVLAAAVLLPTLLVRALRPRLVAPALAFVSAALAVGLAAGGSALASLPWLLLIAAASHELGRLALRRLGCLPDDPPESLVLCLGLGSGLLVLGALALGLAGLLTLPAVVAPLVALLAVAEVRWLGAFLRRRRRRRPGPGQPYWTAWQPGWLETALLGCIAFHLLAGYTMGLAPEIMSDAVRQHLAVARAFADRHAVVALPHLALSYWPLHGNLLFAIGTILNGPVLAKLLHTATGALAVATVGALGRRYAGPTAGLVAAALVAALPAIIWELGTGYIDLFVVLYAALAALCLLHWQEAGGARWPLLMGAMLGFGVAAKLTFGFIAVAAILALLLVARERAPWRERTRALLLATGGGLLTGGPWLVRSAVLTGQIPGVSLLLDALGRGEGESPASLSNLTGFGIGRTPGALLLLPWELTIRSGRFGENADGFVGFAFLLLLPLLLLLHRDRGTCALGTLVLIPFLLWFYSAQYIRYLLPTLALLAVLLGAGFARLRRLSAASGGGDRLFGPLLGVGLVGVLATAALPYLATIAAFPGGLPVRLVLGRESPEDYLTRTVPSYATLRRLDQAVPLGAPVAALQEDAQLYTHASLLTPFTGAPGLLYARTVPELVTTLQERQIGYVLINRNIIPPAWGVPLLMQPDFLRRHADVAYATNNVYLYRLRPEGLAATAAEPELLQNPGFEEGQGAPAYWSPFGKPGYDTGKAAAHAGRGAVRATAADGYQQTVRVRPGQAYQFSYFARSDAPGALARLQINWLDTAGKMLIPTIEVVPVGAAYAQQTMWAQAPEGAAFALVYVSAHAEVPCWFDDFSFKEAR